VTIGRVHAAERHMPRVEHHAKFFSDS